VNFEDKMI
jgi:hypothetical protein